MSKEKIESANQLCQQALEVWSTRKFTEKYMPQIISLLAVQVATDFVQAGTNVTTSLAKSSILSR